jgi:hypothetical protein
VLFRLTPVFEPVSKAARRRPGRPHSERTVEAVRHLWETSDLTARAVAAQAGVSPGTAIRWANVCGWERPASAPRAAHQWPGGRPGAAVRRSRAVEAALRVAADAIEALEGAEAVELAPLETAMRSLESAQALLAGPPLKRRNGAGRAPPDPWDRVLGIAGRRRPRARKRWDW